VYYFPINQSFMCDGSYGCNDSGGTSASSSILRQLLRHTDGSPLPDGKVDDEQAMLMMNPDVRDALSSTLLKIGDASGKLSIEVSLFDPIRLT
jgi:hypothetical protein